ncbi:GAF domain-containing protein [Desulfovibrio intestinalis]|uniref:Signal transduction protein with GAF and PtsI domain n=1 Tax=Desulfovibrio intestinalis TaxID=58621 RepID=A0A7W8C4I2_9BACT|nr:GAF domain-containing protein [Desulfovibrio intestinalis]MBB5143595.1 signal transduction protein with GAF and PtsI domain [Desulfovibrio intestinalis]
MAQDYFRALRDVALVINSSLEPKDVLHKITEQTAVTMGCKASTIRLLDSTGRFLLPSAAYGLSATYLRKGSVEVKRSGMDGEVLAGKTIHLKDAAADGRFQYPESAKAEGLVSVLSSPLMVDGKAIGLIRVYSAQERDFTADEQTFMEAVAAISALAIENARLHEALRNNYELMTKHAYSVYED